MHNIVHFAVITVGYIDTALSVSESAGVAQLTVAISVPPQGDPIETHRSHNKFCRNLYVVGYHQTLLWRKQL